MKRLLILATLALGGCAAIPAPAPAPAVSVSGPQLPASAFTCKGDAVPPDPATVAEKGGSAAASYEAVERAVAADCRNKLRAVGAQESAAGNVIQP
ncbi:hypothetical protein [Bradyrhizobium sp. SZCCHNS1012]|uniref:hypothetical protein n=1 Tax=Bradyrhizobium sp. SZCCHNS1012 TaxID=3057297 RepID=UPI002915F99D|nr:hypothetical protein [Bradyrhizobium sp. SZCCHNS1012]